MDIIGQLSSTQVKLDFANLLRVAPSVRDDLKMFLEIVTLEHQHKQLQGQLGYSQQQGHHKAQIATLSPCNQELTQEQPTSTCWIQPYQSRQAWLKKKKF